MHFGRRRVFIMHEMSLIFFITILVIIVRRVPNLILLFLALSGASFGIALGFFLFKFYITRLQKDTIILKGFSYPHTTIYIIFIIIGLPIYVTSFALLEEGEISSELYGMIMRIGLGYINGFCIACFIVSLVTEIILLKIWERKNKKILFVDLGGFGG